MLGFEQSSLTQSMKELQEQVDLSIKMVDQDMIGTYQPKEPDQELIDTCQPDSD